jgi:CBS domain-containing protein
MLRPELPCVKSTDDLATVLETFSRYEVSRLPVSLANTLGRVIGLISRQALMRRYHGALTEAG